MILKSRIFIFLLCLFVFVAAQSKNINAVVNNDPDTTEVNNMRTHSPEEEPRVNNAFTAGEYLKFNIKYGIIHAGSATMQVVDIQNYHDREAYLIKTTARSARGFEWIFKVRDTVKTIMDAEKFYSLKYVKKLREGSYFYDLISEYDQINGKAYVERTRYYDREATKVKKQRFIQLDIPSGTLDILSSFYKVRLYDLQVNKPIYLTNHDNKKIYDLQVDVLKKETIEVPAGKFRCIKIEPRLKGEAIFKQKGRLWVWVTDDQYKIPVKMDSKVLVGSISTELDKIVTGPKVIPAQIQ